MVEDNDIVLPISGRSLSVAAPIIVFLGFTLIAYSELDGRDVNADTKLQKLHFFFFNDTATTEIYTLSLHDALPISSSRSTTRSPSSCLRLSSSSIAPSRSRWHSARRKGWRSSTRSHPRPRCAATICCPRCAEIFLRSLDASTRREANSSAPPRSRATRARSGCSSTAPRHCTLGCAW